VYVSILGDAGKQKRSMQGLQSAHGVLQRVVAAELRLKHTPTLEFIQDRTPERGMRIMELLEGEEPS
jgi:ribosome-binding factor A